MSIRRSDHLLLFDILDAIDWNEVFNAATLNVPTLKPHIESILATFPAEHN